MLEFLVWFSGFIVQVTGLTTLAYFMVKWLMRQPDILKYDRAKARAEKHLNKLNEALAKDAVKLNEKWVRLNDEAAKVLLEMNDNGVAPLMIKNGMDDPITQLITLCKVHFILRDAHSSDEPFEFCYTLPNGDCTSYDLRCPHFGPVFDSLLSVRSALITESGYGFAAPESALQFRLKKLIDTLNPICEFVEQAKKIRTDRQL